MPTPQQRVIVYQNGLRKSSFEVTRYHDNWRAERAPDEYFECSVCKRKVKKDAEGFLKKHYADFKNKIHCRGGSGKQC